MYVRLDQMVPNFEEVLFKDDFDLTPLHVAAQNRLYAISKLLIDKGADVNAIAGPLYGCITPLSGSLCESANDLKPEMERLFIRLGDLSWKYPKNYLLEYMHIIFELLDALDELDIWCKNNHQNLIISENVETSSPLEEVLVNMKKAIESAKEEIKKCESQNRFRRWLAHLFQFGKSGSNVFLNNTFNTLHKIFDEMGKVNNDLVKDKINELVKKHRIESASHRS